MMTTLPKYSKFWLAAYFLAMTAALAAGFWHWGYDDPYITYRYALNLAQGQGFVYNLGERTLSTTTVLMVFLLAGLYHFSLSLPQWANLVGAASLAAGALAMFDLARTLKAPVAGWAALALYPTFPLLVITIGSETPLMLALLLWAFAALARRRYGWMTALSALAALARLDALVGAAFLYALLLWRSPRRSLQQAARLALLLVPWFVFAWGYFGSPIPLTLAAKRIQGGMPVSRSFASGLLQQWKNYNDYPYFLILAGLAAVGVGAVLWWVWKAARSAVPPGQPLDRWAAAWGQTWRSWLSRLAAIQSGTEPPFVPAAVWGVVLAWPAAYTAAFILLGVSSYFWYYAPVVAGFFLAAGVGLQTFRDGMHTLAQRMGASPHLATAIAAALLIALSFGQARHTYAAVQKPDTRLESFRQVGDWLNRNTLPQDTVGALEIGLIGFYAERPMVDFAGLLQPDIAESLQGGRYEDGAAWAIQHYHPAYVVLPGEIFPHLEQDLIEPVCPVVYEKLPAAPGGYSLRLRIYDCRSLP